mmetsp:Transcript_34140/g.76876  ORF Transcript_34140/g.76876 Transcript_34140/m.76876 type:complete len:106 (+) Transcript_34140:1608-1925(+)
MDSPEARGGGGSLGVTRKLQGGRNLAEGKGDGGPRPRQRLRRHELEKDVGKRTRRKQLGAKAAREGREGPSRCVTGGGIRDRKCEVKRDEKLRQGGRKAGRRAGL